MTRTKLLGLFGLMTAGLMILGAAVTAQERKTAAPADSPSGDKHGAMFKECAKACDDCARLCGECAAHCAKSIADGNKHHLVTLKTCSDCAAICHAASCILSKQGPFSDTICTACADACKRCGEACEQHGGGDAVMKACAEECKKCEEACRDMLKHAGQPGK
jgi:hypothetical protein